jgi:anti-sigma factor RsiW
MDHQAAQEQFSQLIEGDLSPEQEQELRAHLDQCAACRREFDALRETLNSLSGLSRLPAPKEFDRKVQQRIQRRSRGRFFGAQSLLTRIPFEWISFVIILLMLMMYFMVLQSQTKGVKQVPARDAAAASDTSATGDGHR